jgi:hypothetical protein
MNRTISIIFSVLVHAGLSYAFQMQPQRRLNSMGGSSQMEPFKYRRPSHHTSMTIDDTVQDLIDKAARLRQQAQEIRSTLPVEESPSTVLQLVPSPYNRPSEWTVTSTEVGVGYRLYLNIGREPGTWIDPRWGASGKRMDLTLDVMFCTETMADATTQANMVQDNFGGKRAPVYQLESAPSARLKNGFDKMKCFCGGYRVDVAKDGKTIRFHVNVDGKEGPEYGDISIPNGCLYFSLPCFGQGISQLSTREGLLSVRQIGWHTGLRREESRIIGTFRAVPIEKATKQDKY